MSATADAPVPGPATGKHGNSGLYVRAAPGLKLRDKKVERLARKVRAIMPWLEPSDTPVLRAFCELEILANQVYATLRAMGVVNKNGEARRLLDDYRKLRQTQAVFARELGMTPQSRAALKVSGSRAAFDLAAMMSEDDSTCAPALENGSEGAPVARRAGSDGAEI